MPTEDYYSPIRLSRPLEFLSYLLFILSRNQSIIIFV